MNLLGAPASRWRVALHWKHQLAGETPALPGSWAMSRSERNTGLSMKICRFKDKHGEIRVGLVADDNALLDLTPAGIAQLHPLLESDDPVSQLNQIGRQNLPRIALSEVQLGAPVERQEVWAAGVTYLRSRAARMEESDFSATAYDRVYAAERPEIFLKALAEKV